MTLRSTLLIAVLSLVATLAFGDAKSAPALAANIESVTSGGYWEAEGRRGRYRIVVQNIGWEHVHSEMTIDWIEEDPSSSSLRVFKSSPIAELNDGWSVGTVALSYVAKKPVFSFTAAHSGSGEQSAYELHVGAPGKYRLVKKK
jgi:hypothetical protein